MMQTAALIWTHDGIYIVLPFYVYLNEVTFPRAPYLVEGYVQVMSNFGIYMFMIHRQVWVNIQIKSDLKKNDIKRCKMATHMAILSWWSTW